MAVQKVNSEAESSHIAVINKVAGIAISPSYGAHNKNVEGFLKKKKHDRGEAAGKRSVFLQIPHKKTRCGSEVAVIIQIYTACLACAESMDYTFATADRSRYLGKCKNNF